MVECIITEIEKRKNELHDEIIDTIYFGGGTPSVLEIEQLKKILESIYKSFRIRDNPEITFEANPDDLKVPYIENLINSGINRLSIGIQSFFDKDLSLMRRSHDSPMAHQVISDAKATGFKNINIDLIYGIPGQTSDEWSENLEIALNSGIQHISAYHLTFEPGTVFDHWRKKGRITPVTEDVSLELFKILLIKTGYYGFEHYEISNYALPGYISEHNTNYWKQKKYIGTGPSAHSYDGIRRRWNINNNRKYIDMLSAGGEDYYGYEVLTETDLYNEVILTSLRMNTGVDLSVINEKFGEKYAEYFSKTAEKFIKSGRIIKEGSTYKLSEEGFFIADYIMAEFFEV